MADIKIHTKDNSVKTIFSEAMKAEKNRISYALQLGQKKINFFERRYKISSREFLCDWTAEDLEGKDIEYVDWAGEVKLHSRLRKRLAILQGIEYVD